MSRLDIVKRTVLEIADYVKNGIGEDELKKSYKDFVELYPSLFKMIIENGEYTVILDRMIAAAKMIENGQSTQEDMDKTVGEELAKEYIYPNIDMSKETNHASSS